MGVAALPLKLERVLPEQKDALGNLMQLCIHELTHYAAAEVNDQGRYDNPQLDTYFSDPSRIAYFIIVKSRIAGFVLLSCMQDSEHHEVSEFFVLNTYRGLGLGGEIAGQIFELHPGLWRVPVIEGNDGARSFWRKLVRRITLRRYSETIVPGGRGAIFEFRYPPDLRGAMPGAFVEQPGDFETVEL